MNAEMGDARLPERFWVGVSLDVSTGCWLWVASRMPSGYGRYRIENKRPAAHRVSYEALVGPIPDGLQLDHLCRVRSCVNPAHLEAVTQRENILRGESSATIVLRTGKCHRGHDGADRYPRPGSNRTVCNECRRMRQRERYRSQRQKVGA